MIKIKKTSIQVVCKDTKSVQADGVCNFLKASKETCRASLIQKERILRQECRASLQRATARKARSLCFAPFILHEVPVIGLTRIITQEIHHFLIRQQTSLQRIIVATPDKNFARIFKREVRSYLNHLLKTLAGEPYITVDVIIELKNGIVIIERKNPPFGWALPGGFVDRDESLEAAVRREAREETHLRLKDLRQFHTYSDPKRDARFHTVDTVFIAQGVGLPHSGDDAKDLKVVPYTELLKGVYAFDHKQILKEYLNQCRRGGRT